MLDAWRARKALRTRTAPTPVGDRADPRLLREVEAAGEAVSATDALGDPTWHYRHDGALQLVGLDATRRSVCDVRQRLARLVHETALRHLSRRRRRVLAVVLCAPDAGEGLVGWHRRLMHDTGEVGEADWNAARRHVAVLAIAGDERRLFGGDRAIEAALSSRVPSFGG